MNKRVSLKDLLEGLLQKGVLDPGEIPGIVSRVESSAGASSLPWFVRGLVTMGAWTGAICFVAFLDIANLLSFQSGSLTVWGLLFLGGAVGLQFIPNLFCRQAALALSAGGHGMLLTGLAKAFDGFGVVPFAAALLCAVLYPLYRDYLHRFLSSLLVPVLATVWLILHPESVQILHLLVLLEALIVGAAFIKFLDQPVIKPMGFAMAVSLLLTQMMVLVPEKRMAITWWPSNVLLTLGVLAVIYFIGKSTGRTRSEPMLWAALGTIALGAVTTPGLIAAAGLLALGHAIRDRNLENLGLVFVPVFIFVFYYHLDITLLNKSYILAASGALLLGIRAVILRRPWAAEAV